jgi:hypothetical protein
VVQVPLDHKPPETELLLKLLPPQFDLLRPVEMKPSMALLKLSRSLLLVHWIDYAPPYCVA